MTIQPVRTCFTYAHVQGGVTLNWYTCTLLAQVIGTRVMRLITLVSLKSSLTHTLHSAAILETFRAVLTDIIFRQTYKVRIILFNTPGAFPSCRAHAHKSIPFWLNTSSAILTGQIIAASFIPSAVLSHLGIAPAVIIVEPILTLVAVQTREDIAFVLVNLACGTPIASRADADKLTVGKRTAPSAGARVGHARVGRHIYLASDPGIVGLACAQERSPAIDASSAIPTRVAGTLVDIYVTIYACPSHRAQTLVAIPRHQIRYARSIITTGGALACRIIHIRLQVALRVLETWRTYTEMRGLSADALCLFRTGLDSAEVLCLADLAVDAGEVAGALTAVFYDAVDACGTIQAG